jgi:hypothetical protein
MLQWNERLRQWYLRWFRRTVIPKDARLAASTLEQSQLLRGVSGARRRRAKEEGVPEIKSRYSWHRGVVLHGLFGRARFPGCVDVVLLRLLHGMCL